MGVTTALRYEPCTQFINVSQRALHIYWHFFAMSHAIHKIVSKRRCQSYFISRRSPHHGISKDSDLCASAHRCPHYAYARLIARVTFNLAIASHLLIDQSPTPAMPPPNKKEQYYTRDLYIRSISSHEIVRSRGRLHRYTINVV